MSECNFSIRFSGDPTEILNRAQAAIQEQGGHFTGNGTSGAFELTVLGSSITGTYKILGEHLSVSIDNKPFMIPCSTIQNYLTKYLDAVRA